MKRAIKKGRRSNTFQQTRKTAWRSQEVMGTADQPGVVYFEPKDVDERTKDAGEFLGGNLVDECTG